MAPRVRLRPAEAGDLPTLVRFSRAMAMETESRVLDPRRLREGLNSIMSSPALGFLRVAEVDEGGVRRIVGQLMVTYEWSDWRNAVFWWIQSVYVDPSWRRQGVYRAMHQAIRREARSTPGVGGLRLYVEETNRPAQRTYRQLGMTTSPYRVLEDDFIWRSVRHPQRPRGRDIHRRSGG